MTIFTDARCAEYGAPGHPERATRIVATVARLRAQREITMAWREPAPADAAAVRRAHDAALVEDVRQPAGDFDADTPAHVDLPGHALRAAGGALAARQAARCGETAFSLMRPPGHHATRRQAMGFCYFNNAAIAALAALADGTRRVAVFDFDVHHGNGTEDILLDVPGAAFYSVHQHPAYPGTGQAPRGTNCFNFPARPRTPREAYRDILAAALAHLRSFQPELVVVSAGFDAYRGDPLAQQTLEPEDFHWLGRQIRALGLPACHLLEGGYSDELPDLIFQYLRGLAGA